MIDHVLIATLKPGASPVDVTALMEALYAVSREADGVIAYRIARDAGLREGNDDIAIVARFRDEEAFRAYLSHPRHVAALTEYAPRVLGERHSVQFVTEDR